MKVTQEGVGTYNAWTWKMAGLSIHGFGVHTDVVPNKSFTHRHSLSALGTVTYTFEPEGTGTRLTMERHAASVWRMPPLRALGDRAWLKGAAAITSAWKTRIEERRREKTSAAAGTA